MVDKGTSLPKRDLRLSRSARKKKDREDYRGKTSSAQVING